MPAMLTSASPRILPTVPIIPGRSCVGEEGEVLGRLEVDHEVVDLDQPFALGDPDQGAGDRHLGAVGERAADGDQVAVVRTLGIGQQADLDAALGGEQRGVHVGDLVLDDVGEDALERRQLEHLDVVLDDLAAHLDVDLLGHLAGQGGEDPAELLDERDAGADVLGDHAALHVDRVRHQLARERQPHGPGDRDAGLLLGLVGRGAEVRGGDDVLELEEGRVGARLLGEHVEAGCCDPAGLEGVVQRALVDDATAGGVDEHQPRPRDRELVGADQPDGLGCLGQVHADEVGLGHQVVEADHPHPHLGGPAGLDVGVVGDDVHAERAQPLRDEHADAAEADDADGLLEQLGAGVAAALPLTPGERGVGRADVPRRGEQQRDGELGGADDVGGRRVDHHHAALRRGLDVDVVEADTGARHDLEARSPRTAPPASTLVAERTRIASTSAIAASSSSRSAPLH